MGDSQLVGRVCYHPAHSPSHIDCFALDESNAGLDTRIASARLPAAAFHRGGVSEAFVADPRAASNTLPRPTHSRRTADTAGDTRTCSTRTLLCPPARSISTAGSSGRVSQAAREPRLGLARGCASAFETHTHNKELLASFYFLEFLTNSEALLLDTMTVSMVCTGASSAHHAG